MTDLVIIHGLVWGLLLTPSRLGLRNRAIVFASITLGFYLPVIPDGYGTHCLAFYTAGWFGDFSLLLIWWSFTKTWVQESPPSGFWLVIALIGSGLYFLVIAGVGPDAYAWGFQTAGFWVVGMILSVIAWYLRDQWLLMALALISLAWYFQLLESRNIWDYLVDPIFVAIAITQSVIMGIRQIKRQSTSVDSPSKVGE